MIRKFIKFRLARKLYMRSQLPQKLVEQFPRKKEDINYVQIFRVSTKPLKGSIACLDTDKNLWYVKLIPDNGYSGTNMMYGKDRTERGVRVTPVYWCENGRVYIGRIYNKILPDTIKLSWSYLDVKGRAKQTDITLSDNDCREILQIIDRRHDASIGVNWDVIDSHIDEYINPE